KAPGNSDGLVCYPTGRRYLDSHMTRTLVTRSRLARTAVAVCASLLLAWGVARAQAPSLPQTPVQTLHKPAFRAVSYDVSASLAPDQQILSATAMVELESSEPSRTVEC